MNDAEKFGTALGSLENIEENISIAVSLFPYVKLDQIKNLDKMDIKTMKLLNTMCEEASARYSWTHKINCDFREGDKGQHGKGKALDLVFYRKKLGDVLVLSQFIFALRFNWGGIGFYPYWNIPGIHCDTRKYDKFRAIWWRGKDNKYYPETELHKILTFV